MLEIGNTVVSFELFEHLFCCDIKACKGQCCVEGDAGAPLTDSEVEELNAVLPKVIPMLSPKAQEVVKKQGASYIDSDGDAVTSLVNNRECVFTYFDNGVCMCMLEKAHNEGLIDFPKPISCYLYPVRLNEYPNFTAVNVHHWECCKSAEKNGHKLGLPLYKFLKNPLIRHFGKEWYEELCIAAESYFSEFKSID